MGLVFLLKKCVSWNENQRQQVHQNSKEIKLFFFQVATYKVDIKHLVQTFPATFLLSLYEYRGWYFKNTLQYFY